MVDLRNQISGIQELTNPEKWHLCKEADNLADLISRSCPAEFLMEMQLWVHGLLFLTSDDLIPKDMIPPRVLGWRKIKEVFGLKPHSGVMSGSPLQGLSELKKSCLEHL